MTRSIKNEAYELDSAADTPATDDPAGAARPVADPFDRDRFLLRQKHLALTEKYAVFDEQGRQIMFVRREAHHLRQILAFFAALFVGLIVGGAFIVPAAILADQPRQGTVATVLFLSGVVLAIASMVVVGVWLMPKRHVGFFIDQTMTQSAMTVLQDKKLALINATYTAADADLNLLGWFRKNYLYDIVRKRWYIYGSEGELLAVAMEDSIVRSILRRVFREYLPLMRTNFIILGPDLRTKLGGFNRQFTLFDKYVLDMSNDVGRRLDRRLALALGVLLDTGEKR